MMNSIAWDITPCSLIKDKRCFGGKFLFHLQRRRMSKEWTSMEQAETLWKSLHICNLSTRDWLGNWQMSPMSIVNASALLPRIEYSQSSPWSVHGLTVSRIIGTWPRHQGLHATESLLRGQTVGKCSLRLITLATYLRLVLGSNQPMTYYTAVSISGRTRNFN